MRQGHLILSVSIVLIITMLALSYSMLSDPSDSPILSAKSDGVVSTEAPPADVVTPPTGPVEERVQSTPEVVSAGLCTVQGRVLRPSGAVIPGARVQLVFHGATTESHRTKTDVDGSFRIARIPTRTDGAISVVAENSARLRRDLTLWPDALVDVGDLVVGPAATIRGVVLGPADEPVPAAVVHADDGSRAQADDTGRFSLTGLAAGAHRLRAQCDGYAAREISVVEVGNSASAGEVTLRLYPAHSLSGQITDAEGNPLVGASIAVKLGTTEAAAPDLSTHSSTGGFFRVDGLPASDRLNLSVTATGFLPYARQHASDAQGLRVRLTPVRSVFGRVLDAVRDTPVEITHLQLVTADSPEGPWRCLGVAVQPPPSAEGSFRIPLNIHCYVRVIASGKDFAPVISKALWMGRTDVGPIVMRAELGSRLAGRLLDDRGKAVPGAVVDILAPTEAKIVQAGEPVVLATCITKANGGFETSPLASGRYDLRARRLGYAQLDRPVEVKSAPAATLLELELGRAGVIRGQLRLNPIDARKRWRVVACPTASQARPGRGRWPSSRVSGGDFLIAGLQAGEYEVQLFSLSTGKRIPILECTVQVDVGRENFAVLELAVPSSSESGTGKSR